MSAAFAAHLRYFAADFVTRNCHRLRCPHPGFSARGSCGFCSGVRVPLHQSRDQKHGENPTGQLADQKAAVELGLEIVAVDQMIRQKIAAADGPRGAAGLVDGGHLLEGPKQRHQRHRGGQNSKAPLRRQTQLLPDFRDSLAAVFLQQVHHRITERKEHAAQLTMLLKPQVQNVFLMVGSDKPKEKREKLDALHATPANEEVVVVATGKYIGEGFDAPRLDTLLLAMPISWKGTLAQYAGRLHRNYEGKHEVRIYDYVDIRIPMLERMYHKRLKGYADLGYQVKFGAADERVSMIYNGHTAMSAFEQDLSDAARSIIIVSPFLQQGRVKRLLPLLRDAVLCGVKVMIYTVNESEADEARRVETATTVELLKEANVDVVLRKELAQRYAVIDESIVWYGSVDLLAFGRKDADVLRFENADIAGDLLALNDESMCEQLIIQDAQYES